MIFFHVSIGKTALDLANDPQMVQILNVKSVRKIRKTVNRLEGPLLRRSRFLGWRPIWVCIVNSDDKTATNYSFVHSINFALTLYQLGGARTWRSKLLSITGRFDRNE